MSTRITGTFDVTLTPDPLPFGEGVLGRFTLDKRFHGPLEATSVGQMLSTRSAGSAGYVAIERVTGTLDGRAGSFVFQHSGTIDQGVASLELHVVPDSGTDALTGLRGAMEIVITDGVHHYAFSYTLPA